jgi:uncharacterized protein (DUF433 family)
LHQIAGSPSASLESVHFDAGRLPAIQQKKKEGQLKLIGIGLYTFQDASRLTKIPTGTIRRWLGGYTYRERSSGNAVSVAPLWTSQLSGRLDGIGFRDLIEIRFVYALRRHGVSLKSIRHTCRLARDFFGVAYPFTTRRFQTEGRTIVASAIEEAGQKNLRDLVTRDDAFRRIIEPSLYRGIEFDAHDNATLWYPSAPNKAVLLDPKRSFGQPIVADCSIRTSTLYDSYVVERDRLLVARIFNVSVTAVDAAIDFEEKLGS